MLKHRSWKVTMGLGLSLVAGVAAGQPPPEHAAMHNTSEMKFVMIPGLPTCVQGAVQTGDPASTGFILFAKGKPGCAIPWHWHTANERLMIVSGNARVAMRGEGGPVVLRAGGFAQLPSKHVHEFHCNDACTFYLHSDAAFDIHYVDPDGNEIPAEQALKPMKETVATAMR